MVFCNCFRASATVKVPQIPEQETWQVGWIQACTDMVFLNTYGSYGVSSWEFPELKTGAFAFWFYQLWLKFQMLVLIIMKFT